MKLGEESRPLKSLGRIQNLGFPPENLKIWVNSREIHAFIQTANYPPFTKGTGLACPGRGMRRPNVGGVHRPAHGHDGQWPAGRCGQCGPRRPKGDCRTGGCAPAVPPPPHRLTLAAMDPSLVEALVEQSSQGSAIAAALLQGGGGVAHPLTSGPPVPSNLHGCYLYIFIYEYLYKHPLPPPPGMGNLTDMWGTPPPHFAKFSSTLFVF